MLNDDSSPVGRRHLAVVFRYQASDSIDWDTPVRGEKSITQLRWLALKDSSINISTFEYWSQLCIRDVLRVPPPTSSSFVIRRKKQLRPPHILCVVGTVGSGKSEATRCLREDYGYQEVNSGRVLARLLGLAPVPATARAAFQERASEFFSTRSAPAILANALVAEAGPSLPPRLVIDGLRHHATVMELRQIAAPRKVGILFVHTPPDVAFTFFRNREQDGASIDDFLRVREADVESEVGSLISKADAVLYNWNGRVRFRETVRALLGEVYSK